MPPTFLVLWLTDSRLQGLSASTTMWGKSDNKSPYIHISIPLVLFLWRPPNTWVFWYPLKAGVQGDCLTSSTLCPALPLGCTELSDRSRDSLTLVQRGEVDDSGLLSCVPQPYIGGVTATFPLPNQNPQSGFCSSDGTLIYTVYHWLYALVFFFFSS